MTSTMLSDAIKRYISEEITLDQKDIEACAKSRQWLLDRIASVVEADKQLRLYAPVPFVHFGSYFKGTKVRDVDEFDILVVIDSNDGQFWRGGNVVGQGLGSANPNPKYGSAFAKTDGSGVSPSKMLNWMRDMATQAVKPYGGEAPERNGQAVTARIISQDLAIDLVPAGVFADSNTGKIFYNIPRGDRENGWIVTSPRDDINLINSVAKGKDHFKNVVRIAKRLRDKMRMAIPSFAIESAFVRYGRSQNWLNWLSYDLPWSLKDFASQLGSGTILDPMDSKTNLLEADTRLAWYAERIRDVAESVSNLENINDADLLYVKLKRLLENE